MDTNTQVSDDVERFSQWCILELMGHRRLAGLVTECQIAGHGFLRLDVPGESEDTWSVSQFYSPSSVYCMTPTTEQVGRSLATRNRPEPATRWELEPRRVEPCGRFHEDGYDEDEP